jgi:hypothetical protein
LTKAKWDKKGIFLMTNMSLSFSTLFFYTCKHKIFSIVGVPEKSKPLLSVVQWQSGKAKPAYWKAGTNNTI